MNAAYYQLCPKCNGWGNLGAHNTPSIGTSLTLPCDVCNGAKVLLVNGSYEPTRGMIAAMAMQGMLSRQLGEVHYDSYLPDKAVKYADQLLEELNKPKS